MKGKRFPGIRNKSLGVVAILMALFLALSSPAYAANPAPVQIFYVTLPEVDALTVLSTINSAAVNPTYTYFSVAVGVNNTYVYYDQWEDGYAADIANPTAAEIYNASTNPGGVQIWGNGESDDGCAPNIAGVDFTCTDDADVLNAGNVIIPYNAVTLSYVNLPAAYNVLDRFSTVAYNNNDGNTTWATNWVETGDDGSPSSGDISITGNLLRFYQTEGGSSRAGDRVDRRVDLSRAGSCATLTFTLGGSGLDTGTDSDRLRVYMSSDGGTNFTQVAEYSSSADFGSKSIDILSYATATSVVDFISRDQLESGEYWTIDDVQVTFGCSSSYYRDPNTIYFDAKDKIGASASIAMARAVWASGSNTLNAFAHELYATTEWGTAYESPVGTDTPFPAAGYSGQGMFEYAGLSIMAGQNSTTVDVDVNGDGDLNDGVDINDLVLQEGGSYLVSGISQGARVTSDKAVQVALLTGDIGSNYETRDMNLLPTSAYGTSYWAPVGVSTDGDADWTTGPTRLFLYNPSGNVAMTFTCTKTTGSTTSGSIAAGDVWTYDLSDNQAAHCTAAHPFFGIATNDTAVSGTSTGQAWDWSYTLYPDNFLSTDALVGLGLGRDPNSGTNPTENGSPIWVTPVCNTYVFVDWDNNGTPDLVDLNGDGDTGDIENGINENTSNLGMYITTLKSVRMFQPSPRDDPYDQSGARVWSRTTAWAGGENPLPTEPGCKLALAWGQDPRRATASAPGLDVGTSVPPLRLVEGTKTVTYANDTSPVGVLNPGDRIYYNITIANTGSSLVQNVHVYDQVPAHLTYYANSTEWGTTNAYGTAIPDDGSGTPFPLDVSGGVLLGDLAAGSTFYVRFQATLDSLDSGDYAELTNCDTAFTGAGSFTSCVTRQVATRDWGDLPNTYGTAAAANGPNHSWSGLNLGAMWDFEGQGQPSTAANGDDSATSADEDGVALAGEWKPGTGGGKISVTVNAPGGVCTGCRLGFWIDWNGDGDVADAGESYVQPVVHGTQTLTFDITGVTAFPASLYGRFRLYGGDYAGSILSTGFVSGGEVEDYRWTSVPTAVDVLPFKALGADSTVALLWETASEVENAGFNLYRSTSLDGERVKVNETLIPSLVAPGSAFGASYEYVDTAVRAGKTYYYWLETVDIFGTARLYGPADANLNERRGKELPPLAPAGE